MKPCPKCRTTLLEQMFEPGHPLGWCRYCAKGIPVNRNPQKPGGRPAEEKAKK